jgi:uncharacterized protein (DUF302 family)
MIRSSEKAIRLQIEGWDGLGQMNIQSNSVLNLNGFAPAFIVDAPFDSALAKIRRAIREDRLCIAAEIDTARRLKRAMQIQVSPCKLLLIDNPSLMLETTAVDRASGIFIPLHLVVSAAGDRTLVHMLGPEFIQNSDLPIGIRAPVTALQYKVLRVLRGIADKSRAADHAADRGDWTAKPEVAEADALS